MTKPKKYQRTTQSTQKKVFDVAWELFQKLQDSGVIETKYYHYTHPDGSNEINVIEFGTSITEARAKDILQHDIDTSIQKFNEVIIYTCTDNYCISIMGLSDRPTSEDLEQLDRLSLKYTNTKLYHYKD